MSGDAVRRVLAVMEPVERRRALSALLRRVEGDPGNVEPLTALWWAICCDIADVELAERELAAEIDGIGPA